MKPLFMQWSIALVATLCVSAVALAQTSPAVPPPQPASSAPPLERAATIEALKEPTVTSLNPSFFVVGDSPEAGGGTNSMMTIGVATEIRKAMAPLLAEGPWIMPEPSWKTDQLVTQCHNDSKALGGVVLTYYAGAASHFFLVYQEETETIYMTAQIIACNHPAGASDAVPTIVGVIAELPGAHGTPWIVRRSQVSVPLVSFAGLAAIGAKGTISTKNTDATSTAVIASLFTQSSNRDIPGYSQPLKLRFASQHVGVDLVRAMRDMCTTHSDVAAAQDARPRDNLCTYLGFTLDPAQVSAQQDALDKLEAEVKSGNP